MSLLTTTARCLDATCGWSAEGDWTQVERSASKHVKVEGHGVSVTTTNPEAPVRAEAGK